MFSDICPISHNKSKPGVLIQFWQDCVALCASFGLEHFQI
jgi:hypothetical protein